MPQDRRVDPIYFFNSEGVPVLNIQHLLKRNALLEHQVERLMRMLRSQAERNKFTSESAVRPILH
jgi:hypothetical protein